MDASTRSFHIYGKTEAGIAALRAAREGLPSSARRLLILIDGQRTLGELTGMLGVDAVEMGLAQLDAQGFVEFLRRFPGADEPGEATPTRTDCTEPLEDTVDDAFAAPQAALAATAGTGPVPPNDPPRPAPPQGRTPDAVQSPRRPGAALLFGALAALGGAIGLVGYLVGHNAMVPALPTMPADPPWARAAPDTARRHAAAPTAALPARVDTPATGAGAMNPSVDSAGQTGQATSASAPPAAAPVVQPARAGDPLQDRARPLRIAPAPAAPTIANAPAPAVAAALHVRRQVTPAIPAAVRERGITSGHVAVVLHVTPEGLVGRVELLAATPPDVYDRAMEEAFAQWTFDPLGIPGRMTIEVDIRPPQ